MFRLIGNCQLENKAAKGTRFDFDPRALEDRKFKKIADLDLKGLEKASDGKAAILAFSPQEHPFFSAAPDLSDAAIDHEETVIAKEELPLPPTLLEKASKCDSVEEIIEAASAPLSSNDVRRISDSTAQQSGSKLWFAARAGRITASTLKQCID